MLTWPMTVHNTASQGLVPRACATSECRVCGSSYLVHVACKCLHSTARQGVPHYDGLVTRT